MGPYNAEAESLGQVIEETPIEKTFEDMSTDEKLAVIYLQNQALAQLLAPLVPLIEQAPAALAQLGPLMEKLSKNPILGSLFR